MATKSGTNATVEDVSDVSLLEEGMEGLRIIDSGATPFNLIPCTGPPEDFPDGDVPECSSQPGAAAACVLREKLWAGRQELRVFFMNPEVLEGWKSREGTKMTIDLIMKWVSVWEKAPSAPVFKATSSVGRADIRVKLSDEGRCWSMKGMDAEKTKKPEPTMMLNLTGSDPYPESYLKHLVIHEFGHALGLEHEHQRSDFWDTIKDFIDTDTMESDPRFEYLKTKKAKKAYFGREWKVQRTPKGKDVIEFTYDSESVMHYWFSVQWIKNRKYHTLRAILDDPGLTEKQKLCLQGIHDRNNSYALEPSAVDYKTLEEAYGGVTTDPPKK